MIQRDLLTKLHLRCFQGKTIVLIGPRQVGKTTLLKALQRNLAVTSVWLNADEADVLALLSQAATSTELLQVIGQNTQLAIIDEAQQIPNIGQKLKLLHDNFPHIQIIATGSSAFELQNHMNEPLTGRHFQFELFPVSFAELIQHHSVLEAKRQLETRLIYGAYPDVINHFGAEKPVLMQLANSYLFKDIFKIDLIRKPEHIEKLVRALAFQVGSEVSFNELAKTVGNIDVGTVEKYIGLLQKAYIVFQLPAFSRNLRNEIKKGKKYYFYDNGIRNALINNFTPMAMRFDKGALWENFLIAERMKRNRYGEIYTNDYFWRTKDQAEIDYVEEMDGYLHSFEFKWQDRKKAKLPKSFAAAYPQHTFSVIEQDNYVDFIV